MNFIYDVVESYTPHLQHIPSRTYYLWQSLTELSIKRKRSLQELIPAHWTRDPSSTRYTRFYSSNEPMTSLRFIHIPNIDKLDLIEI